MANQITARDKLITEIKIRLGGGIVDNELDPEHYDYAITVALDRYRQRSGTALEESFVFLTVQPDVATYTLPNEVQQVMYLYRRSIGGATGGANIDPFSLAMTNNMYMIQNPGGLGGGGAGSLAMYDFAMQFQALAGRMFGRDVMYSWDSVSKKLTLHRQFHGPEEICVHCYLARPEEIIMSDVYAKPWIRDYSISQCKLIQGEARTKFANLAGPQGGVTFNGDAIKNEALAEIQRLDQELTLLIDQGEGYGFCIG